MNMACLNISSTTLAPYKDGLTHGSDLINCLQEEDSMAILRRYDHIKTYKLSAAKIPARDKAIADSANYT